MNAIREQWVPLLCALGLTAGLGACGERAADDSVAVSTAPAIPLTAAADAPQSSTPTNAGGIAARYTPHFDANGLVRIEENRGHNTVGEYAFQGARLMRYEGAPVYGSGTLVLEFDLQGALVSASKENGPASGDEINAIRTRAQLLRNHALAQHASRTHAVH
jgi:hypothetical protein